MELINNDHLSVHTKHGRSSPLIASVLLGISTLMSVLSIASSKALSSIIPLIRGLQTLTIPTAIMSDFENALRWVNISLLISPLGMILMIFWIILVYRREIKKGIQLCGLTILLTGLLLMIFTCIIFVIWNASTSIRNIIEYLGFPEENLSIIEVLISQTGNSFLYYSGMSTLGFFALGLSSILFTRVFKREGD
jgi:hypothetical protein